MSLDPYHHSSYTLAKEAAVEDGPVVYKMPREVITTREKENDFICGNGSGRIRGRGQ